MTTTLADRLPDLAELLGNLSPAERRAVEDAFLTVLATAPRRRPSSAHPMLRTHSPEEGAAAVAKGLARERATRAAMVADSYSTAEAAQVLGITPAAVTKRRTKAGLVAFRHKSDWRYPRWQFAGGEVLAGVPRVWQALPDRHDVAGLAKWFTLPNRQLKGKTPAALLAKGRPADVEAVADAASYVGSR